jgi:hypothetical protein
VFYFESKLSQTLIANVEVSTEWEGGIDLSFNLLDGDWLKSLSIQPTYWTRATDNAI